MADKYHKAIGLGGVLASVTYDGVLDILIDDGDIACAYLTPAQARELAAMLTEAADVADGARPAMADIPLQYEQRATLPGDSPVESEGWLRSDLDQAGAESDMEG